MAAWDAYNSKSDDMKFEDSGFENDEAVEKGGDFNDSHFDENLDNWKGVFLDYGANDGAMECDPPAPIRGGNMRRQQQLQDQQNPEQNTSLFQSLLNIDMCEGQDGLEIEQPHMQSQNGRGKFFTKPMQLASKLEKKCTEKQRREKLSEQFQELTKTLGLGENHKNNRVEILERAIQTLKILHNDKIEVLAERDQLLLQLSYIQGAQTQGAQMQGAQMGPKMGLGVGLHNMYGGGLGMHPFMNPPMPRIQSDLSMMGQQMGQQMPSNLFGQSFKMGGNSMSHSMPRPLPNPMAGNPMSNPMVGNQMPGNQMQGNSVGNQMPGNSMGNQMQGNSMVGNSMVGNSMAGNAMPTSIQAVVPVNTAHCM